MQYLKNRIKIHSVEVKMSALGYEHLLRAAFGHVSGESVGRHGDPAGLAEADIYRSGDLGLVKIGTGYAMQIFLNEILNQGFEMDEEEFKRLEEYAKAVMASKDLDNVSNLITDFRENVIVKYYNQNKDQGGLTLKQEDEL